MRTIATCLIAWTLSSAPCAAQDFTTAIVRLHIMETSGKTETAIAVSAGLDGLIVACSSLKSAASVTQDSRLKPNHRTLVGARIVDNLCLLNSDSSTSVRFAQRNTVVPDIRLIAIVADPTSANGYRQADAEVRRKEEGGRGRVLFVAAKATGTSLDGAALFTSEGEFVGISSSIPGAKEEYATLLVESPTMLRGIARSLQRSEGSAQSQARSNAMTPELTSGAETIGVSFSYLKLATFYGRTQDYEKGVALAEQWRVHDPDNAAAWLVEAGALRRLNFTENALASVERALKMNPDYLPALTARLNLLRKMGRVTEAEIEANKLVSRIVPLDGIDEAALVGFLAFARRPDEARARARSLLAKEPSALYARNVACLAELTAGGSVDSAVEICKALAEQIPESVSAWVQLSHAYLRKLRHDDSIVAAKRALAISVEVPEAWHELGIASEAKGDVATANEAEQRIAEYDPKLAPSYKRGRSFATCYRQVRDKAYSTAVTACETATRLNDRNARAFFGLGTALMRERRVDEGIVAHERAIALDPTIKGAWSDLVIAYSQKRDITKAKGALEKLGALDKPAADALAGRLRI